MVPVLCFGPFDLQMSKGVLCMKFQHLGNGHTCSKLSEPKSSCLVIQHLGSGPNYFSGEFLVSNLRPFHFQHEKAELTRAEHESKVKSFIAKESSIVSKPHDPFTKEGACKSNF